MTVFEKAEMQTDVSRKPDGEPPCCCPDDPEIGAIVHRENCEWAAWFSEQARRRFA